MNTEELWTEVMKLTGVEKEENMDNAMKEAMDASTKVSTTAITEGGGQIDGKGRELTLETGGREAINGKTYEGRATGARRTIWVQGGGTREGILERDG